MTYLISCPIQNKRRNPLEIKAEDYLGNLRQVEEGAYSIVTNAQGNAILLYVGGDVNKATDIAEGLRLKIKNPSFRLVNEQTLMEALGFLDNFKPEKLIKNINKHK